MLDAITESLNQTVQSNPWLAPLAAFAGGLLTAANPCVLAMVPLMIAYVAGQNTRSVIRSFLLSLVFSVGLILMFAVMFLATWAVSSVLRATWWTYVAAAVCLLMGLHMLGVIRWRIPAPRAASPQSRGVVGAFLLGLLFGLVSLPCAGPVLLAVLALVPLKGVAFGSVLLASYGLGHCGLILVGGTSMALVQRMADSKGWNRGIQLTQRLAGAVILLVGVLLLAR